MSSQTIAAPFADKSRAPSQDFVNRIVADSRRRSLLRVLEGRTETLELDRLAELVVADELDDDWAAFDEDRFDRVLLTLYHNHVPMLADAGFVDYERTDEGVFVTPRPAAFDSFL